MIGYLGDLAELGFSKEEYSMVFIGEEIIKKIIGRLQNDSRIDPSKIDVFFKTGVVTLKGTVPTLLGCQAATDVTLSVPGVVSVNNELRAEYPPDTPVPEDDDIHSEIETLLYWNLELKGSGINVTVEDGAVTLEGSVDAYWKKVHAEGLISYVRGVVGVTNKLTVVPTGKVVDENIAKTVTESLDRNVAVDSASVNVKVENRAVTLSGTLPTLSAKKAAFFTAVYTDGVVHMNDRIVVKYN
jgi:osmotically-inducible protein OsmY